MIKGKVVAREAVVSLEIRSRGAAPQTIQAAIDTGYNGYLTLPKALVSTLQLQLAGYRRATLADGSSVILESYLATITWHGKPRDVLISQTTGIPLIGMALLHGNRLTLDVLDGGDVLIDALPPSP
jgi:clan AA aspartic protease